MLEITLFATHALLEDMAKLLLSNQTQKPLNAFNTTYRKAKTRNAYAWLLEAVLAVHQSMTVAAIKGWHI